MFNGIIDKNYSEAELKDIENNHKLAQIDETNGSIKKPGVNYNLVGRDSNGNVVGGIMCNTYLMIMFIDVLWVHESHRGQGLGYELVKEAERIAKELGCIYVHTSTFSYQSPGFYKHQGYEAYTINDYFPYNICMYNLRKKLDCIEFYPKIYNGIIDKNCTETELKDIVCKGLRQYNIDKTSESDMKLCNDINLVARDNDGNVVGGIMSSTYLMGMYINVLWVHESYRSQGLDSYLVNEAEKILKASGGIYAHTSTYSFQTHEFFKRHGYEAYDIDDYFIDNICLYSFKKKL